MKFVSSSGVLALHAQLISETGGQLGLRDRDLLESAVQAAENRFYYEQVDVPTCAATDAYHLCNAHAFVDGNKRIAAAVAETFLVVNGWRLILTNRDIIDLFLQIADGRLTRASVDEVFQQAAVPVKEEG